jgi:peptidoglycan hydrolase-like protein with peptidoglycan-binding domain
LPRIDTKLIRAAGGLLLAGGLSFCYALPVVCAQTPQQKVASSGTAAKTTSTTSGVKKKPGTSKSARSRMQMAPTPDRIRDIQSALAKSGSFQGEPTGKWDAASMDAMKRFQQMNGLLPTGKLTALSLQKLGLGSDTAGRGAPRPVTHLPTSSTPTTPGSR